MTDRELLELAAKACGYDISHRWNALRMTMNPPVAALCIDGVSTAWNPLIDDGAAMRLAVKLGFDINHWERQIYAGHRNGTVIEEQYDGSDPYAATRRAIVRAAAEIGKALP